ncbi:hypothetical protein JW911_01955 [Candidatus Peregrinibacteria bacterium]|nr:hypothetical protein [Candidatus Peregrinibacteria bacterium]
MKFTIKSLKFFLAAVFIFVILNNSVFAQYQGDVETDAICTVYLTGIGCPNCAVTDPVLLQELTAKYPRLVVIEYEIYKSRASNQKIIDEYFKTYIPVGTSPGVPFIIFDKENTGLGRFEVLDASEIIESVSFNRCPLENGSLKNLEDLDLTKLNGKVNIWTKNRVLQSGTKADNAVLQKLIFAENVEDVLNEIEYKKVNTETVPLSGAEMKFDNAIIVGDWIVQWRGDTEVEPVGVSNGVTKIEKASWTHAYWIPILISVLFIFVLFYLIWISKKKFCFCFTLTEKQKDILIISISLLFLVGFFFLTKNISPALLEEAGYSLPLPVFTFFIALIDGFNPCNIFVLTFLLGLLVSASHSRARIFTIGYTFIFVVFVIYFLFMAAWLNIFKYIGFITPLRIAIAAIALIAGIINCKELLFFRKGITLMIQDQHKGLLERKIEAMKEIIQKASLPALITSSIGLAAFASLVELPCTAGFPIIYTGILSGKMVDSVVGYYMYLLLYNFIYVVPLIVIITVLGYTFKAEKISKRQMQIIKFIGGLIMILLGIILLFNPGMIGLAIG